MKRKLKSAGILVIAGILTLSPCSVYAGSLENGTNLEDSADYELENNNQNSEQPPESESIEESGDMSETEKSGNSAEENERETETENDGKSVMSEGNNEVSENENQIAPQSVNLAYQGKAENDSGNFANVVVFVEFQDTVHNHIQSAWGKCYHNNPRLTELFQGDDDHPYALKKYLQNISYGELEVANIFPQYDSSTEKIYPYTLKYNLDYYADDSKGDNKVIDEVTDILASSNQISSDILLDRNGDGCVDNLTIIVPCEGEGNSNQKYYGHQSTYGGKDGKINGKSVAKYTLVTESVAYLSVSQSGVIVHEFLHTLGYQDLYKIHNNDTKVSPVGRWDIMASQSQWLQYPLAYFRSANTANTTNTKWFSIPTVTDSQKNYSLYAASAATEETKDRQAVILKTDQSSSEFFVLEYRKKTDGYDGKPYDQMIYGSGLVIYRINTVIGSGNSSCPPYMAYVFRSGDTYDGNGCERAEASLLEQSFFSAESGRTSFGNSDKDADVTKNAITYSDGTNSGIVISNIGSASGDQISFDISFTGSEDSLKWNLETEDTTGLTLKRIDSCRDENGVMYYVSQTGEANARTSVVMKYNAGNWSKIAEGPEGSGHKIAVYDNDVYILYLDSKVHVRLDKLVGNNWVNLFTSAVCSTSENIALDRTDDGIYFTYVEQPADGQENAVYVHRYSDKGGMEMLGTKCNGSGLANPSISSENGNVVVEYYDCVSHNLYIQKYNEKSNSWESLLNGTMKGNNVRIDQNGDLLYLLKNGTTFGDNKSYLYVYDMSVTNSEWMRVGSNEVMDCSAYEMDICFNGNKLYILYRNAVYDTYTTRAMTLENNQWVQLGSDVSRQALSGSACYYDNGKCYVTYLDLGTGRVHVRSMQLNEETEKEIPIESIALNQSSCTLKVGENTALTAVISPENTTEEKTLTWVSGDDSVAAVDSNGKITAKKAGTAVVTVKTCNGKTASCKVTVEKVEQLTGWQEIDGKRYYFMPDGHRHTGWLSFGSTCYYMMPDGHMHTGWLSFGSTYYYLNKNGVRQTGWQEIDGKRYYFMPDGHRHTGWLSFGSQYYYLDKNGVMQTGWQTIGGNSYYFNEDGLRTEAPRKDGWLTENGKKYYYKDGKKTLGWQDIDGKRYYMMPDGHMHMGWLSFGSTYYYMMPDGHMHTGWLSFGSTYYYLNKNGVRQTGWQEIDGKRYYMMPDGHRHTGWLSFGSRYYYLDKNGVMQTGWQTIGGNSYYFNEDGLRTEAPRKDGWLTENGKKYYYKDGKKTLGWQDIDGKRYYMMPDGHMHTGWLSFGSTYYYMMPDGHMHTGWLSFGSTYYYLNKNGVRQTGWQEIDGKRYYFMPDGHRHTGWLSFGSQYYYLDKNGVMQTGWQMIDGKKYYFSEEGLRSIKNE